MWITQNDGKFMMRARNLFTSIFLFLCFGLLFHFAITTRNGQIFDGALLYSNLGHEALKPFFLKVLQGTEYVVIIGFLILIIIGVAKQKYADTIFLIFAVILSNVATQYLKHYFFMRPDLDVSYVIKNSYPSGHVALIVSVFFALLLVSPFVYKIFFKWIAFLTISFFAFAVCVARWHRLSDVIGSILLCTAIFVFFIFVRALFAGQTEFFSNIKPKGIFRKVNTSVKLPIFLLVIAFVLFCLIYALYMPSLNMYISNTKDFARMGKSTIFLFLCVLFRFFCIVGFTSLSLKILLKNIISK